MPSLGCTDADPTYDGREIANFILDLCDERGFTISNLSLQKLVYFCHAWTLKKFGRPLVAQEFEAWPLGPVLPYLYQEFKDCGDQPITKRATKLDMESGARVKAAYSLDAGTAALLDETVTAYGGLNAFQLVQISHVAGGPWDQVWNSNGKIQAGMRIKNEAIAAYYSCDSDFTQATKR